MLTDMTTGRYDGRPWPGYLGTIDLPEWEAEHLIKGGNAEYPDTPLLDRGYDVLAIPEADYESKLKRLDGVEEEEEDPRYAHQPEDETDYDSDFDRDDGDNDFERGEEITPQVKRPYANANKAKWIDYVVEKGLTTESEARRMTKDQLMELDS